MINHLLCIGGVWILSDGIYSILLYLNKPAYHGEKQTWWRDHSIRLLRIGWGIVFISLGIIMG